MTPELQGGLGGAVHQAQGHERARLGPSPRPGRATGAEAGGGGLGGLHRGTAASSVAHSTALDPPRPSPAGAARGQRDNTPQL